ncbi:MAG: glycosyl transferase family 2 [Phycisphaeraceae bacterium]|nr:glycosyl transferase family 2 [Phycisphaeraceae bacterium]
MTSATLITLAESPWHEWPVLRATVLVVYLVVLGLIGIYGLHRYWLVFLFLKNGRCRPAPADRFNSLPEVTVQLPLYNEARVAERVIDAACRLDYPADRLQIQVLDDSNDEQAALVRRRCEHWARQGVRIQHRRRDVRTGYKAGALRDAMPDAVGQFVAIFDADFVPPSGFLRETIHYFTDPGVGMVQARWEHLNRRSSLLTRIQALFLDGHFVVEHTARNRSRCWMNFNGTAGVWRRTTIEDAGGWRHDTLTEDLDLSYRAQLAGWKFVYLPEVVCPAELPPEINAFKSQQHRWTKGSIQTAIKLLPGLLRSRLPLRIKIEAFFHLTCPMVYVFLTTLALLFFPTLFIHLNPAELGEVGAVLLAVGCIAVGLVSVSTFYVTSQCRRDRSVLGTFLQIPMLMSLGVGMAVNNTRACIEALVGHESPFVRTPKYDCRGDADRPLRRAGGILASGSSRWWVTVAELAMGFYMLACTAIAMGMERAMVSVPFLTLFAIGYFYVGLTSLWVFWQGRRPARPEAVARFAES